MGLLFWLFVGVLVIAIAVALVQKVVKLAITAAIVLFLALMGYYLILDNAPEPVVNGMESAADKLKTAGGKAASTVGGKAAEVGKEVGQKALEASKAAGARAAQEAREAAAKAGEKIVEGAAQGAKEAVKEAAPPPAGGDAAKK